jgi:tRNA nucleotidyltransferase/poly(A) polymerase
MNNLINKIFFRSQNLNYINLSFKNIAKKTEIEKIFNAINTFSENSEIRYVGGCIRKILNKEEIDDIDLAVNLNPVEVCSALKKKNINFYESGIEHGTITALINNNKFEITSLRKDVDTDGRHAKVLFSKVWYEDALRRDFSINSIYADKEGNLFDPFNGKKDLVNGKIIFIGNTEKRIKEDYLRILRYIRFFLNYSKQEHNSQVIKIIKRNINGLSKISSERLLGEFKKLVQSEGFLKLAKDNVCLDIITLIFPQLKNINIFKNLNNFTKKNIFKVDFIFLLSLMIIDETDNVNYFIYKFNISKKDQKRLLFLNDFHLKKITTKNLNKILYFNGREAVVDIIYFKIFKSKKVDNNLLTMIKIFEEKEVPIMPISAIILMKKYNIPEGKKLGNKLKKIEELWVNNNFEINEKEIQKIINN